MRSRLLPRGGAELALPRSSACPFGCASACGANAVNGVVNIVTRSAWETTGGFAELVTGNQERFAAAVRYALRGASARPHALT